MADEDGPTHPYIGAAPACWRAYAELGVEAGTPRLAFDVYPVQHPGVPGRRASQSVALHLTALCAVLERSMDPDDATDLLQRRASVVPRPTYPWLEPPASPGALTVHDVLVAPPAHRAAVTRRWAEAVWHTWDAHHDRVRAWLDQDVAPIRRPAAGSTSPARRSGRTPRRRG